MEDYVNFLINNLYFTEIQEDSLHENHTILKINRLLYQTNDDGIVIQGSSTLIKKIIDHGPIYDMYIKKYNVILVDTKLNTNYINIMSNYFYKDITYIISNYIPAYVQFKLYYYTDYWLSTNEYYLIKKYKNKLTFCSIRGINPILHINYIGNNVWDNKYNIRKHYTLYYIKNAMLRLDVSELKNMCFVQGQIDF